MELFVPEHAIDYDEVFRRGGRNFGDEDFALFKCPRCARIFLWDYEVDVVFPNPANLAERLDLDDGSPCPGCGEPWHAPFDPQTTRVTWDELRDSGWRWAANIETMLRNQKRMNQDLGR